MFSGMFESTYFMGIVLALLVLSILFQIIIGVLYQKMIRETDNMAVTENKLLKQCKLKFTNCFELNEGNVNIPVFVDKFINQLRFAGVSLTGMAHLSGQFMLLSVFAAGVGACKGIIDGGMLGELLPYYIVSLFGLYAYFSVSSFVDAKGKNGVVRTNLIDYLENHMVKHLNLAKEEEMQPYIIKEVRKGREEAAADVPLRIGTAVTAEIVTVAAEMCMAEGTSNTIAGIMPGIADVSESGDISENTDMPEISDVPKIIDTMGISDMTGTEHATETGADTGMETGPKAAADIMEENVHKEKIRLIETKKQPLFTPQDQEELEELLQEFLA